jgi:hypothetical protein
MRKTLAGEYFARLVDRFLTRRKPLVLQSEG